MNQADRKRQLIVQGAVYRAEIILARQITHASLRPDSIAKSALQQIAATAFSAFKNRSGGRLPGLNLQTMLPLLMSGLSALLQRKSLLKTVLRGVVVASVAAAVVASVSKKKTATNQKPDNVTPQQRASLH